MTELSIKEKAKAYDKATKVIKNNLDALNEITEIGAEDEKIRNEIIAFIEQSVHCGGGTPIPEEQENKWIAWLEKQGEQKPADLRTWKCIVDAVVSEREGEAVEGIIDGDDFIIRKKEGIGQNVDSPWVTEVAKKLQERFGNIKQKSVEYAKGEDYGIDDL